MRIFVDGTPLFRPKDGVGQYTYELLKATIKADKSNHYVILGFKGDKQHGQELKGARVSYEFLPIPRKLYSLAFKIRPLAVNRWLSQQPDLVIYPNFVSYPLINNAPSLVVVCDLVHEDMPEVVEKRNRRYLARFVPYSIGRPGAQTLTISEFVASSILKHYGNIVTKATHVPLGVDQNYGKIAPAKIKTVRGKYNLPPGYILFVGSLQPRKNIGGVLAAYSRLPARLKSQYPLVLAGAAGWKDEDINRQIKLLEDNGSPVIKTGFVANDDLPALFAGATVFVFPSIYEGFGLPILEAMSAGVPVITANTTAMPATAGDAARLVNPYNPLAIEEAMRDLLTHESKRNDLIKAGQANVKRWTWEKSAKKMLSLIKSFE